MSHLPMEVDRDAKKDWFRLQLESTLNVEPSAFNDWFTGHLNFQVRAAALFSCPALPRSRCLLYTD
jgi:hypothetical protein